MKKCFQKMRRAMPLGLCLTASLSLCAYGRAQQFVLKDGETVVFYGDSITAQRRYTRFVEDFVLTRYPGLRIRFFNAGVPGDKVDGGYAGKMPQRVQRDVEPFHPGMIAIMLGMNDGWYGDESPEVDAAFLKGYRELLDTLRKAAPSAALTLIQPSPYDEITHGTEFPHYSRVIADLSRDVARIAAEENAAGRSVLLADGHAPLDGALQKAVEQSPELAQLIIPDRIHPQDTGHWIIAAELMKAWHVDPVVSSVTLNATSLQVTDSHRTAAAQIEKTATGLRWTQTDEALPLPLDFNNAMTLLLPQISDIASLDQQTLRVENLVPGTYQLLIGDKSIAAFSDNELKAGVNLALYKTPMNAQARDIDSMEQDRMQLDQARFILSANLKEDAASVQAENKLRQAQDELDAQMRTKLAPTAHRFELRRQ
ncbi:MAG TPA: SGNH/GDSL hydrolase family protein [Terracidiphilus sp.]|jgi:lysophospholipase L1-like esterase